MKKQLKQKKKPINIETLENNVNVLSFIQNDFNEIVGKETEINNEASKRHSTIEHEILDEKEKSEIILNELITSCEEKKRKLENYVKFANEIIKKNNALIDKRKKEISSLIMEKDLDISLLQRKIDSAKSIHDDLNTAVVNVFKNLKMFLSYRTQGKINIGELSERSAGEKRDDTVGCDEQDRKKPISGEPTVNSEHWDKKLCEENKMKLHESINSYKASLQSIKQMIEESIKWDNKLLHIEKGQYDTNSFKIHGDNNNEVSLTVSDKANEEKREDNEIRNIPSNDDLQETTDAKEEDTCEELVKPVRDITEMMSVEEQILSRKEESDINKNSNEDTSRNESETETETETGEEKEEEEEEEEDDDDDGKDENEDENENEYESDESDDGEYKSDESKYKHDGNEYENEEVDESDESEKENDDSDMSGKEREEDENKSDISKTESGVSIKNSEDDGAYNTNKKVESKDEEVDRDVRGSTSIYSSVEDTGDDSDEDISERDGVDEKETNSATTNSQSNEREKKRKEKKTYSETENFKSKGSPYMLQGNAAALFDETTNKDCSYLAYYERRLKNL